jgi:hypothetical protein
VRDDRSLSDLSFGGAPTPARRGYAARIVLVLAVGAAVVPLAATGAAAATGPAAVRQQGDPQPSDRQVIVLQTQPTPPKPIYDPDPQLCQPLPQQPCAPIVEDPDPDPTVTPAGPSDEAAATDVPDEPTPTPSGEASPTNSGSADTGSDNTGSGGASSVPADDPMLAPLPTAGPTTPPGTAVEEIDLRDNSVPTGQPEPPVLQIAGLGLLGAITTIALTATVVRRRAAEHR